MPPIQVLVPSAPPERHGAVTLAARGTLPPDARLALICNGKAKAREVLEFLAEELRAALSIGEVTIHQKLSAGVPLSPAQSAAIAERADLVVTALGDCGACSACSLHDAIAMELLGVPATVVITDVFQRSVAAHAHALGADGYHTLVLPHPISSRGDERIRKLVRDIAATARVQLTEPARALEPVA